MIENFGNKINTNGFDKNPENINMKGAPKKTYKQHIDEITSKGYKAPTKQEYFDMIALLLSMTKDDLNEYASNEERPYWIRLIIQDLDNDNARQKLMDGYRDWLFGKADTPITVTAPKENPYASWTKEELEELDSKLKEIENRKKDA